MLKIAKQSLETEIENTKTIPWNRCWKQQNNPLKQMLKTLKQSFETDDENTKTIPKQMLKTLKQSRNRCWKHWNNSETDVENSKTIPWNKCCKY